MGFLYALYPNATIGFFSFLRRPGASKSRGETERRGREGSLPQGGRGRSFELIRDRQRQTSRVERAGSIGEEGEGTSFCEGGRIVPAKLASLHEGGRRHEPPSFLPSFLPCTLENNYPSRIERNNVGSFFLFFLISPRVIYPIWPIDHPPPSLSPLVKFGRWTRATRR